MKGVLMPPFFKDRGGSPSSARVLWNFAIALERSADSTASEVEGKGDFRGTSAIECVDVIVSTCFIRCLGRETMWEGRALSGVRVEKKTLHV